MPSGITLGEDTSLTIEDTAALYISLHQCGAHIERMCGKFRTIPHRKLDEVKKLDNDKKEQTRSSGSDMPAHLFIRHGAASLRGADSAVRIPRKTKLAAMELPP